MDHQEPISAATPPDAQIALDSPRTTEIKSPGAELLTGTDVAKIVSESIDILGFETGCTLVEPSYVLAMAGLKGENYVYSIVAPAESAPKIEAANKMLESKGIRLLISKPGFAGKLAEGRFDSLRGYDHKSHRSTKLLPMLGVEPFNMSQGFEGFESWRSNFFERLSEVSLEGPMSHEFRQQAYAEGIMLGYPDQAIIDFDKAYKEKKVPALIDSMLLSAHPAAQRYSGAHPDFSFAYESADDPEITTYIESARRILREFYESVDFKRIEGSENFITAYSEYERFHEASIQELWKSREQTKSSEK